MATATLRCRCGCKQRGRRELMLVTPSKAAFINESHAASYAQQNYQKNRKAIARRAEKIERQARTRFTRKHYDNDTKTRKAAAIREFNAYIRERDRGLPCISCGKPICDGDYCAGHYIPAGNNSLLRFDEFNVNGQHNTDCNKHKSGDQVRYRKGLILKFGEAEVDRLESTNGTIKRAAQDYKAIEIEYRNKRLALIAARGGAQQQEQVA